jgi:hypothetical protein
MMSTPPEKRMFPPVLADRLSLALFAVRPLGERALELVAVYRRNQCAAIAKGGLNADFRGISNGIPADWFPAITNLCDAFDELHAYNADPSRFISRKVYRAAQAITSSGNKIAGDTDSEIEGELLIRYFDAPHGTKGEVKKKIAEKYFVSERHVDSLIRKLKFAIPGLRK